MNMNTKPSNYKPSSPAEILAVLRAEVAKNPRARVLHNDVWASDYDGPDPDFPTDAEADMAAGWHYPNM